MYNELTLHQQLLYLKTKDEENITEQEKKEEEIKAKDIMIKNVEKGFTSGKYNTSDLESGKNDIIKQGDMTITLTTTNNQKNGQSKKDNLTNIDLGECENILKNIYNIPETEHIYIKKIDVIIEGMKIPKIEYDVYAKINNENILVKLNLSYCENSKIDLSVPVELNEDIDKLNSSSGYYNDLCYTATSDIGTDIILNDRKNEFISNNKTVCQDECIFSNYDYDAKKAKCSCRVIRIIIYICKY